MKKKRLILYSLAAVFLLILAFNSVHLNRTDCLLIFHSPLLRLPDRISSERFNVVWPFAYDAYSLRYRNRTFTYPAVEPLVLTIARETKLHLQVRLTYDLDLPNIGLVLTKYGYSFNEDPLKKRVHRILHKFFFALPKVSVVKLEKYWVLERLREVLAKNLTPEGLLVTDIDFKVLRINRLVEKKGSATPAQKPKIAVVFLPGLTPVEEVKGPSWQATELTTPFLSFSLSQLEGIMATGKLPHDSLLFLSQDLEEFDQMRSRFIWEIFANYLFHCKILFPPFCAESRRKELQIFCREHLAQQAAGHEKGELKELFDRAFAGILLKADDPLTVMQQRLYAECAYTLRLAGGEDYDLFISFVHGVDDILRRYLSYTPPRDPHIDFSQYLKYNRVVAVVNRIGTEFINLLYQRMPKNSILLVITPYQYQGAKKPLAINANPSAAVHTPGIMLFRGKDLPHPLKVQSQQVGLLDVVPSILTVYDFPDAKDLTGGNFFHLHRHPAIVRIIDSYENIYAGPEYQLAVKPWFEQMQPGLGDYTVFADDNALLNLPAESLDHKLAYCRQLLVDHPFLTEAYAKLGLFYFFKDNFSKAEENYIYYTDVFPLSPRGFVNLGTIYSRLRQYNKAIDCFEKSFNISRLDYRVLNNLGYTFMRLGREEEAAEVFRRSLALLGDQPDLLDYLARADVQARVRLPVYGAVTVHLVQVETMDVELLKGIITALAGIKAPEVRLAALESLAREPAVKIKHLKIAKQELDEQIESQVDKVNIGQFTDILRIGKNNICIYKKAITW